MKGDNDRIKAEDVKPLREKLGWTQQQLADYLGIDVMTVSRWERGIKQPSSLACRQLRRLVSKKVGGS